MKNKGFTLIELLVVIAIIGILSSIAFASLNSARAKGRVAAAQSTMRDLITSALLCKDDGGTVQLVVDDAQESAVTVCGNTAITPAVYAKLPSGWLYCNAAVGTQSATNCGDEVSVAATPQLVAEGDGRVISCLETGCTTATEATPN